MQHHSNQSLRAVVESLAVALDDDDYGVVRRLLDPGCVYEVGGKRLVGRDEVIASYRSGSQLGRQLFDEVQFSHEPIIAIADRTYRIRYLDHVRARDETFVHVAEQDVTVSPGGTITRIIDRTEHRELVKLEEFMARHGITRPE